MLITFSKWLFIIFMPVRLGSPQDLYVCVQVNECLTALI